MNYQPNEQKLTQYLIPEKFPFDFPSLKDRYVEKQSIEPTYNIVSQLLKQVKLPETLTSDFCWIITNYLSSFKNHSAIQKDSDWNLNRNKDLVELINFYESAILRGENVLISLRAGKKSRTVDDPDSVNLLIHQLKNLKSRFDKESLTAIDIENEVYTKAAKSISKYLEEVMEVNTKRQRAKAIAYLYSVAGIPFKAIVEGAKRPVKHTDVEWDEEGQIKTVLKYL